MAFLTVASAPTDTLFASLVDVKADLGITDTGSDAVLLRMIQQTTAEMVTAAGRKEASLGNPFARGVFTEKVSGEGDQVLQLSRYPVVSVASVLLDGTSPVTDYEILSADAGQLWRESGWGLDDAPQWMLTARLTGNRGPALYTVSYTAGYVMWDTTGTASGVTVPYDLQAICLEFAKCKWHARNRDAELRSRRVGEVSETFGTEADSRSGGSGGLVNGVPTELWARMTPWREVA